MTDMMYNYTIAIQQKDAILNPEGSTMGFHKKRPAGDNPASQ